MKKLSFLLALLSLCACGRNDHRYVNKDFPENRWGSQSIQSFSFVMDETATGDIRVSFSCIHDPGYDSVPVNVVVTYPDGKQQAKTVELMLKDSSGKLLSDCAGDICDISATIVSNVALPKGSYRVQIKNLSPLPFVPNVLAVGVEVKESK